MDRLNRKLMKRAIGIKQILAVSIVLIMTNTIVAENQPQSVATGQPFSLEIQPLQEPILAGTELKITARLTNTSGQEIRLLNSPGHEHGELNFEVKVTDPGGNEAAPTKYWKEVKKGVWGSRQKLKLAPGESYDQEIVVSRLYDLSETGTYLVEVSRDLPPELGKGKITAKPITVTIVTN